METFKDTINRHVNDDLATEPGDIIVCKCCSSDFKRGVWCFYSLCDSCFGEFDHQKMNGRFVTGDFCEDPDTWMERFKGRKTTQ